MALYCISHPTSFEVEKKPAVTEVEVGVVSILLHKFKQLGVQDLFVEKHNAIIILQLLCLHASVTLYYASRDGTAPHSRNQTQGGCNWILILILQCN